MSAPGMEDRRIAVVNCHRLSGIAAPGPADAAGAVGQPAAVQRELRIQIWEGEYVELIGTAADLRAEGVIPEGFEWPQANRDSRWQSGRFDYWLRRSRPEGHKGPMRSWFELDNWFVRITVTGRRWDWSIHRALQCRLIEVADDYRRHFTAKGRAEFEAKWKRHWEAVADRKFQAFMGLCLPPKRGGRRSRRGGAVSNG